MVYGRPSVPKCFIVKPMIMVAEKAPTLSIKEIAELAVTWSPSWNLSPVIAKELEKIPPVMPPQTNKITRAYHGV